MIASVMIGLLGWNSDLAVGVLAIVDRGDFLPRQPFVGARIGRRERVGEPMYLRFRAELELGRDRVGLIETADRHADAPARHPAVGQGRSAGGAETALRDVGTGEGRDLASSYDEIRNRQRRERHERGASCLLAHAAVAYARADWRRIQAKANGAALTAAGQTDSRLFSFHVVLSLSPRSSERRSGQRHQGLRAARNA